MIKRLLFFALLVSSGGGQIPGGSGLISSTPSPTRSRTRAAVSITSTDTATRSRALSTPSETDTMTVTRSRARSTPSATDTITVTRSRALGTSSPTVTASRSRTATGTRTLTAGGTSSTTSTASLSPSGTWTGTQTASPTSQITVTPTPTLTDTPSNTPGLIVSQTGTQSVTNTPSNNPQLVAANAANAASNNIGIIIGAASGGLLFGVLITAGLAYHTATRPRRIASPPLYPTSHTTMNVPHAYFQEDVDETPIAMMARPRTFSIPPITNQKIPKFTAPSTRNVFTPMQSTTVIHNPFEGRVRMPPPPEDN